MFGVTKQGFRKKMIDDIVTDIENRVKTKGFPDFTIDPYSSEGIFGAIVASGLSEAWDGLQQAYNSRYLDLSYGIQLDRYGKNINVDRNMGKYATTTLEFITDSEITIPKSTYIRIRDTEYIFQTTKDLKIDSTLKGQVQAIALKTGTEYNTPINTIDELVTSVNGVATVTNILPSTGGAGVESDDSYREILKFLDFSGGGSTVNALTSQIRKVEGISNVLVLENVKDEIDENGIRPGFIKVWIEGIESIEVAKAIHKKAAGIGTEGNIMYMVENKGGQLVPINFNFFEQIELFVKVKIISSARNYKEIEQQIKDNITEYVKGANFREGRKIVHNQVEAKAYQADEEINELEVLMGTDKNNLNKNSLIAPVGGIFYLNIEVFQ